VGTRSGTVAEASGFSGRRRSGKSTRSDGQLQQVLGAAAAGGGKQPARLEVIDPNSGFTWRTLDLSSSISKASTAILARLGLRLNRPMSRRHRKLVPGSVAEAGGCARGTRRFDRRPPDPRLGGSVGQCRPARDERPPGRG